MKRRPYRVCDICGKEYHKTHNCMKLKILIDPMRYTEMYGDLPIMSKWDICPKCAEDLMAELMLKVADRKTEPNLSEKPSGSDEPQTCDTCKWGEWYRKGYDITMMDDECGGCCSWNSKWTPKTEPQTERSE